MSGSGRTWRHTMSEERTHHVTVRLARDYEFIADFADIPGAPSMRFDEPQPLGSNGAPSAAAVLGAAIGNCLAASLAFCLRRARMEVQGLTAHVTTHVVRNDRGRFRINGIDVELAPVVGGGASGRLDRCGELFEDFCTVTASVQHGIPVHVSLRSAEDQQVA
jgi:organic hydroperoxide reductase OsmC/OhrA